MKLSSGLLQVRSVDVSENTLEIVISANHFGLTCQLLACNLSTNSLGFLLTLKFSKSEIM